MMKNIILSLLIVWGGNTSLKCQNETLKKGLKEVIVNNQCVLSVLDSVVVGNYHSTEEQKDFVYTVNARRYSSPLEIDVFLLPRDEILKQASVYYFYCKKNVFLLQGIYPQCFFSLTGHTQIFTVVKQNDLNAIELEDDFLIPSTIEEFPTWRFLYENDCLTLYSKENIPQ